MYSVQIDLKKRGREGYLVVVVIVLLLSHLLLIDSIISV